MKIRDQLSSTTRTFSFEFYPPKTPEAVERLFEAARRLRALDPSFVSVTYGAGGSTRQNTIDLVTRLRDELDLTTMSHLTCVGHSQAELRGVLGELKGRGVDNLMLLRGDPPQGEVAFRPAPDGLSYAAELVALAREVGDFSIGVAGYPEGHQECSSKERDLENLRAKVDAGADFVVTQLFDNRDFHDFLARARAMGIEKRIIPGIMPVAGLAHIKRLARMCGATIPSELESALEQAGDDKEAATRVGIEWAKTQCEDLLRQGAPGIHFYTLNFSRATQAIYEHLRSSQLT